MNYGYYDNSNQLCVRRICGFVTGLCIVAAAALVIAHFVIRPKPPTIHVTSIKVSGLSIGQIPPTVSGNFYVELKVTNKNRMMTASYDNIRTAVYYKNFLLGAGQRVWPFEQPQGNSGEVPVYVNVNGVYLQEPVILSPNGIFNINFWVRSDAKFKGWFGRARYYTLTAHCDDLQVVFASGLLAVGGDRSCIVMLS